MTVSDGVAAGVREDASGDALQHRLEGLGYRVDRVVVSDDQAIIETALVDATASHAGSWSRPVGPA